MFLYYILLLGEIMNIILYFIIFISKTIEVALGTLRLIVVANGKKVMGAILQGVISIVWILITGIVVIDIGKDPFRIVAFALGCTLGSYVGSFIEEKMALGSNLLIAIIDKNLKEVITDKIRNKNFAVTTIDGCGKEKERSILMIMVARKKRQQVANIIKSFDKCAMIVAENALSIAGGYKINK